MIQKADCYLFPGIGVIQFSLNGTTYQNNSIVALDDIGEDDDALFCITNLTTCCRGTNGSVLGQWFFPNGTNVPNEFISETSQPKWDFFRDRHQMTILMHRRGGGVIGIYRCEIPDLTNVTQTVYIGVYNTSTGE